MILVGTGDGLLGRQQVLPHELAESGRILGGKGNVILLRYAVGSNSTEEREAGFLDALKKFPGIKILSSDQHAGATRETVSRALRLMRGLGWVRTDHRTITVVDPDALRERCGSS